MKLKDFKIMDCFGYLNIYDENEEEVCMICNNYEYGQDIPNCVLAIGDGRSELEKWELYKNCEVLEIYKIHFDLNYENDYVDIKIKI